MELTPNRRIALNVAATYGRSLVALACGLITGRWSLMALGVVDFGIFGLVGGLVTFMTFFNGVLSEAVARFYALAVGAGDLTECRRWFSTAASVHVVVPLILMAIGYPLGGFAVAHWLTIPLERVADALWVWRFVCIGSLVSMISVPFCSMFVAWQRLGEIALYDVFANLVKVGVLACMVTTPGVWLVKFALLACLMTVVPAIVIMVRAVVLFDACRLDRRHLLNSRDLAALGKYVGWMSLGGFGWMLRGAGMAVLVNKVFGPVKNASFSVANTVTDHSSRLTAALSSAFLPAIVTAYGAGDHVRVQSLSQSACRLCTLALLPFVLPLSLEIDEVLRLWLKTPPEGATSLCVWLMASAVVLHLGTGLWPALDAQGRVALRKVGECLVMTMTLPLAWGLARLGLGLDGVGMSFVVASVLSVALNAVLLHVYQGFSLIRFATRTILPLMMVGVCALVVGFVVRMALQPSVGRLLVTTLAVNVSLLPMAWLAVLGESDRQWAKDMAVRLVRRRETRS